MNQLRSLCVILLFASVACFGQQVCNQYPLNPSLQPNCEPALLHAWKAAVDFRNKEADLSAQIAAARSRFWKTFPNRPGFQDAEVAFLNALAQKDQFYLMFSLVQGQHGDAQKYLNAIEVSADPFLLDPSTPRDINQFPTNVDGGIRRFAFPLYLDWVNALRRAEGRDKDGQWAQPQIMAEAFQDKSHWKKAYEDGRNWAEFLSSGLDISKYVTPQVYMVNQMESDVASSLARSKPADLPDPKTSSLDLYNYFVKTFGQKEVLAAATAVLHTPKNSVGGLAGRAQVVIGTYQLARSPNPYLLFLTKATNSSPRNYAIALCLDQTALLLGGHSIEMLNSKEEWAKAASVYGQLVSRFGEPAVVAAAARLKDLPKDDRGGPRGDPEDKGAIYWFTALLKDPHTQLPELSYFLASSYDPRWVGKMVDVRGTVARVVLDTSGFPKYATVHFKESRNDRFTAFTPDPDILESYSSNLAALVGKPIEVWGQVQDWNNGSGVRFVIENQFKVLDAGALANFHESAPDWMKLPAPVSNLTASPKNGTTAAPTAKAMAAPVGSLVASPKYLAWAKFPPGSKASYVHYALHETASGTNQYTRTNISNSTFTLVSVDAEQATVKVDSIISGKVAGRNGPDTLSSDQLVFKAQQAPPGDSGGIVTRGEAIVTVNGKQFATRWECVTQAGDPLTFTKTWTSDEVPGGLLNMQQQTHTDILGKTYLNNSLIHYVPPGGVAAPARRGAPIRPPALAQPGTAAAAPTPQRGRQGRSAIATAGQPEFMSHYLAVMRRAVQARLALARAQRKLSLAGVPLPDDIRAAQERLTGQQQAVNVAMRTRDYAGGEQSLRAMEGTLAVIEDFVAKGGAPVIPGSPERR